MSEKRDPDSIAQFTKSLEEIDAEDVLNGIGLDVGRTDAHSL
jgi:hypothetical protein